MARDHARLLISIWRDPDWIALTSSQQITYLALLSSEDLSWCGVAPLLPQRLAGIAVDLPERKVRANLATLVASRFLITDEKTAEVAVRSYLRHDWTLRQPNVTKAMLKSLRLVRSKTIRESIVSELKRIRKEEPELKGWPAVQSAEPELFEKIAWKA